MDTQAVGNIAARSFVEDEADWGRQFGSLAEVAANSPAAGGIAARSSAEDKME